MEVGGAGVTLRRHVPTFPIVDLRYTILPEEGYADIYVAGEVYGPDLAGAMQRVFNDPAWTPGLGTLWDFSGVTALIVAYEDVERILEQARALGPRMGPGRGTFVAQREEVIEIARLLIARSHTADRPRRLFTTRAEAVAWLGAA